MNIVERLSGWALGHLSPEAFQRLRLAYLGVRRRIAPLVAAFNGSFDTRELFAHLRERLGGDFDILMVHCSVNNLQPMFKGEAIELLKALQEFVQPHATLVMPSFYFGESTEVGAYEALSRMGRVELRRIPSQMGLLSELFRRSKGVLSSRHPIMRISAMGPLAADLVRGHESADLPCGAGSPFEFMDRHNTLIVGIGKSIEVLTHVHYVEDKMGPAFPVPGGGGVPLELTLVDGKEEIPFTLRSRSPKWKRDMFLLRRFMAPRELREWRFHGVPMFATRAADVTRALESAAGSGQSLYIKP